MLLVNWKESKSLDKQKAYKTWAWVILCSCSPLSFAAQAAPQNLSNPSSIVSIFLSLLLVIGVVFILAFLMRRFNVTQSGTSQLKVVASMMAGTKERVMVIQVGDEQHLLGVTGHNINHLAKLTNPLVNSNNGPNEKFKDKLALFMAGKINPSVADATQEQKNNSVSRSGANT
jgi:flagellar protein FliO/FliZ